MCLAIKAVHQIRKPPRYANSNYFNAFMKMIKIGLAVGRNQLKQLAGMNKKPECWDVLFTSIF